MNIALKEANETEYWIRLLYETEYISEKEFDSIEPEIKEIIAILVTICKKQTNNFAFCTLHFAFLYIQNTPKKYCIFLDTPKKSILFFVF